MESEAAISSFVVYTMFFEGTGPKREGLVEGLQGGMQARVLNPSTVLSVLYNTMCWRLPFTDVVFLFIIDDAGSIPSV